MVTKRIVRISPADKGGAVVVQGAANYVSKPTDNSKTNGTTVN